VLDKSVVPCAIGAVLCLGARLPLVALAGETKPSVQGTTAHSAANHPAAADSLAHEAITLRAQVAKLDSNLRKFSLHAAEYKRSALHSQINNFDTRVSTTKQFKKKHLDNVGVLHDQYSDHVAQYRALVDQYRKFYAAYNEHWQRYQLLQQRYRRDNEQTEETRSQSLTHLSALANADDLLKAEAGISGVLNRMSKLQQESPTLAESYLCPAYDDLQKEFVQAVGLLQTSIAAVPADQRATVAREEINTLEQLRVQMADAEKLHDEQEQLQGEFGKLMQDTRLMHVEERKLETPAPAKEHH